LVKSQVARAIKLTVQKLKEKIKELENNTLNKEK
jgi:hypothetical protein